VGNKYHADYMREYRQRPHARKKEADRHRKRSREMKLQLIQYKGGRCVDCGYNGHPAALHLDHRDPSLKNQDLGYLTRSATWERIVKEADKCDLVCANCHAIRTWPDAGRP
jgi:hypothetical protein